MRTLRRRPSRGLGHLRDWRTAGRGHRWLVVVEKFARRRAMSTPAGRRATDEEIASTIETDAVPIIPPPSGAGVPMVPIVPTFGPDRISDDERGGPLPDEPGGEFGSGDDERARTDVNRLVRHLRGSSRESARSRVVVSAVAWAGFPAHRLSPVVGEMDRLPDEGCLRFDVSMPVGDEQRGEPVLHTRIVGTTRRVSA